MPLQIIFINSHPIQYFAPFYSFCAANGIELEVWYCSDESVRGMNDNEFGVEVKWDIPLLRGYKHRFFRNHSWKPSIFKGFFGLINLGLAIALLKKKRSLVVVHGWNYFSNIYAILLAKLFGHVVCLRGENPLHQELSKSALKRNLKRIFLGGLLFRFLDKFLYIGIQNKEFYKYFGVPDNKLVFTPYSVDNQRFQADSKRFASEKKKNKEAVGLPENAFTIVYSGKYIDKKRPLTLLRAYHQLQNSNIALIMIGDGPLRGEMEEYIRKNRLKNVLLTGFINQSEISCYYSLADVFVMCSGDGETWGLSVNEAMNFEVPILVTDRVGCSSELVQDHINGYVCKTDDVADIVDRLRHLLELDPETKREMGSKSLDIVKKYSFQRIADELKKMSN